MVSLIWGHLLSTLGFWGVGDGCCRAVTALLQILECVYQTEVGLEATLPALAP